MISPQPLFERKGRNIGDTAMGMAASQARYLALVARKSNCEYEGQQINQARTVLSNQTANLFNQMLGLNVPVPPSTQDYTKVQYSFSDGVNNVTMDSWQQLGKSDENYNYVVTYHYNSNVYTGSQKKMNDPQVQFTTTGTNTDLATLKAATTRYTSGATAYSKIQEEYEKLKSNLESAQKAKTEADTAYNTALEAKNKAQTARAEALKAYNTAQKNTADYKASTDYTTITAQYKAAQDAVTKAENDAKDITKYQNGNTKGHSGTITLNGSSYVIDSKTYRPYNELTGTDLTAVQASLAKLQEEGALSSTFDSSNVYYDSTNKNFIFKDDINKALASSTADVDIPLYLTGESTTANSVLAKASTLDKAKTDKNTALDNITPSYNAVTKKLQEYESAESAAKAAYDIADSTLTEANKALVEAGTAQISADANLTSAQTALDTFEGSNQDIINEYNAAKEAYEALQSPEYVGNCKLKLLETLTEDQQAELKQVVKDMKAQNVDADINNCFDENGNYTGGIYQFTLNGKTYYSSIEGLYNSYNEGTGLNHIDAQPKLAYYNASYVSTKIEDTKKALLETDSQGRFTSIRLEDDTVLFTLNAETITDDAAYKDAMNQYYYENAQYDKMVQDINAKTSLIQQEDQQLELRLKQLDTEQNALSTEIDAVSKVVKDNVEKSFKTFGG